MWMNVLGDVSVDGTLADERDGGWIGGWHVGGRMYRRMNEMDAAHLRKVRGGRRAGWGKKEPLRAGRLLDIYRNSKGQKRNASLRRGMVRILTSWLMAL